MDSFRLVLEDDDPPDFTVKVLDVVNNTIQSTDSAAANDAALAIDAILLEWVTNDDDTKRDPEGFFWCFWETLYSFAQQLPHDSVQQDRLAAIVESLANLPPRTVELKLWREYQLWKELPIFGAALREMRLYNIKWEKMKPDEKRRFVNLQAFAARVLGLRLLGLEVYAIWVFTDALEGAMIPIRGSPDLVSHDPTIVTDLSFKVAAAAEWMVHGAKVMYGRDEEVYATDGGPLWKLGKKEGNKLRRRYKGTKGLCPQRWDLWRERFEVIRDCEEVDEKTRNEAGRAVTVMYRAQPEHER
ncbi:hypothetical protein ASPWEDRAFT_174211 [Aspergillus wentii DTO 134E9]|uniref:Uncharacterized protein n=1 Tax=Aspergillus wentii DTO 134E9 TaxID=1073089 RepID=A0A1L9RCW9_ASPWE|nr:uncharacterized protein ASPWEDRAFT_174211 [Aspergillus wentii DTO 134E9]OJJ32766.1 hypothetical protein ASPWEDRAFT_174211 [Aspergillus wentii DTO 134E9]